MRIIRAILITVAYLVAFGAVYITVLLIGSIVIDLAFPYRSQSISLPVLRMIVALLTATIVLRHLVRKGKHLLSTWLLPIPVIIISILTVTGFLMYLEVMVLHAAHRRQLEMEEFGRQMQEYFQRQDLDKLENFRPEDHMELIDELNRSLRENPANLNGDTLISPWRPAWEERGE